MNITSVKFIRGLVTGDHNYDTSLPQVVVYGRSNAGKSTLVNKITQRNSLARVSQNPGRTREANLYLVNNSWYLIDMPGYGYAKTSKTDRDSFKELVYGFIRDTHADSRKSILIVDSKAGITDLDQELLDTLINQGESVTIILNKIDRLRQSELAAIMKQVRSQVSDSINIIPCSSKNGKGIPQLYASLLGE